ncbi:MAG: hypothetical protein LC785_12530 [Acidobacteria bacterium]|nr:hypothetical protein [Acidobacteriota bacterium]MCA1642745.1 hypothetical protein [Acidobacteriota bacterium]
MNSQLSGRRVALTAALAALSVAVATFPSAAAPADKMTPDALVARHLESIGTAQARASVSTRIILGTSQVSILLPVKGQNRGRAVLFSEGEKSAFGMTFKNPEYPRDNVGYDGSRVTASQVTPGVRSPLGDFLYRRDFIFKEGLAGGTLSASWPLLNLSARGAKLEYAGTKKSDGRELHELRYTPRKGTDMSVSLFFETDTFRHVRSEYTKVVPARIGNRSYADNVQERESRYKLVERFSDFRQEGALTLPHIYKMELVIDTQDGTFQGEWLLTLDTFTFNEKIAPDSFNITAD